MSKNFRVFEDISRFLEFFKVLEFFCDNRLSFIDVDKEFLRRLLFYLIVSGGIVRFVGRKGYILFNEFLMNEFDVVEFRFGCLFLRFYLNLLGFYEFLKIERVFFVEAYFKFILKCF